MLRVFDTAGNAIVDTNTPVALVLGELVVGSGSAQSGQIGDGRFSLGTPFWTVLEGGASISRTDDGLDVSIGGNTLSWSFRTAQRPYYRVLFGIR